jgi:nitrobindin-like protein
VELHPDIAPALVPIAWLVGTWRGVGVGGYPTIEGFRFSQEVTFSESPGKPFLHYISHSWLLDDDGNEVRPLGQETGYWRMAEEGALEVLLVHPTGFVEIWLGTAEGGKVELATDAVARTATAKAYTAGHRLYGLVEGELLWAFDMAAMDQPLQPHLSATLRRMP